MNNEVKIQKIDAKNIKAVKEFVAVFGGNSAHITGENGYGKSTIIRVLMDKLRNLSPAIVTKIGESEGFYKMELTDGSRFEWLFNNEGLEKINYYSKDSLTPVKRDVFKSIVNRYFPNEFNINKFLHATEPRKRLNMLSELIKVDLTEIQERYKVAFDERAIAKKELKRLKAQEFSIPVFNQTQKFETFCEFEENIIIEIECRLKDQQALIENERVRLNSLYKKNKADNDLNLQLADSEYQKILSQYDKLEKSRARWTQKFNEINKKRQERCKDIYASILQIESIYQQIATDFNDFKAPENCNFLTELNDFFNSQPKPKKELTFVSNPMPAKPELTLSDPMPKSDDLKALIETQKSIESELEVAKQKLKEKEIEKSSLLAKKEIYESKLADYKKHLSEIEAQDNLVLECEMKVTDILNEIKAIVKSAKLPEEFSIDLTEKNDILFRVDENSEYLPITEETLASSAIYIAAFKLHTFYVDLFRVVHFDVSYLSYINRLKVHEEAKRLNIQLLTEAPASNENELELQYSLITNV